MHNMVVGLGTDIINFNQLQEKIDRGKDMFLKKVYTGRELEYAERNNKIAHLATAFAAKEAVFKALGTGIIDCLEVEIIRTDTGKPSAILHGKTKDIAQSAGVVKILLSLSYTDKSALAVAVLIGGKI